MELIINGQTRQVPEPQTLADVIHHFGLIEKMVVVEHNGNIVSRDQYRNVTVAAGDKIEIVHFVGGG
ncbi:sulfur carrier protein ThiS [Effusibacillus dendaii]|uniref:Thiamine biosynthesis protein ThiS n=1 Tax=Effusibacillus dendaii TaxID=2743772 RepID=A0A7I8D6R7_9BACL|nr:sulfur carrier protein ThiS [Effusibacillus dendaii]BCJ85775.1 thiamine biosynthesis protein ThiS [Effusibacillus dendaii]